MKKKEEKVNLSLATIAAEIVVQLQVLGYSKYSTRVKKRKERKKEREESYSVWIVLVLDHLNNSKCALVLLFYFWFPCQN